MADILLLVFAGFAAIGGIVWTVGTIRKGWKRRPRVVHSIRHRWSAWQHRVLVRQVAQAQRAQGKNPAVTVVGRDPARVTFADGTVLNIFQDRQRHDSALTSRRFDYRNTHFSPRLPTALAARSTEDLRRMLVEGNSDT